MASNKRDLLVDTALHLFSINGFRATGIDKISEESGVAKMTLYKYFKSKDELIIASLARRDEDFMVQIRTAIARLEPQQTCDSRISKLMAYFDALHEWISSDSFFGCNFINASVEFKRKDDPIHVAAAGYQKMAILLLLEFLAQLRLTDASEIARQIHMLVEGAIVMAVSTGDTNIALLAKKSVFSILHGCEINPPLVQSS